jgi:hypothetical protein
MHPDDSSPIPCSAAVPPEAADFYRRILRALQEAEIPVLIGGARALCCYTGIDRHTKDCDLMLRRADVDRALAAARKAGWRAELTHPHWLGKIHEHDLFVDLIFRAGNGLCEVTDSWFSRAEQREIFGLPVELCPIEEMIWVKAFVMERERYDGADIAHLLRAGISSIDFQHLLALFAENWRLLLSQLVLFGFIYPGERNGIPGWIIDELASRLRAEPCTEAPSGKRCQGALLSREQYLPDVNLWGYQDARLDSMTAEEIRRWTAAIGTP